MTNPEFHPKQAMEMARLYYDRCDATASLNLYRQAAEGFKVIRDYKNYLDCFNQIIRIHAEQNNQELVLQEKERLQDLVLKEGFELGARTYYSLGVCESLRKNHDSAMDFFQKALSISLATDSKDDICYAIYGVALTLKNQGKIQEALKEIYNLKVFFQVIEVPEIKVATEFLNTQLLIELKRYDEALELLWQIYEKIKDNKSVFFYVNVLTYFGFVYFEKGEKELARTYFTLAAKSCDGKSLLRLSQIINEKLNQLGAEPNNKYDLVFKLDEHSVVEKKLGKVDFGNQFILLDLLKLFVQNQGQVYSKELMVEKVWKQKYNPEVHDNKIYVTIKRLRKMIEPDFDKPKYIFRAKNGYFMNKSASVLIETKGGQNA